MESRETEKKKAEKWDSFRLLESLESEKKSFEQTGWNSMVSEFLSELAEAAKDREPLMRLAELKQVILLPNKGTDRIHFGMTLDQTEEVLGKSQVWDTSEEAESFIYEMQTDKSGIMPVCELSFKDGMLFEITWHSCGGEIPVTLFETELFSQKAQTVINWLEQKDGGQLVWEEGKNKEQSLIYEFKDWGITLYREQSEEELQNPLSEEEREYEEMLCRFDRVTVKKIND